MNAYLITSICLAMLFFALPADAARKKHDLSEPPAAVAGNVVVDEAELVETDEPIEIADFAEPKSGGVGLWSASRVGLPYDIWQEVTEEEVLQLLNMLPETPNSESVRNLYLRMLLMETGRSDFSEKVMIARTNALLNMGQAKLASKLLNVVPIGFRTNGIEKQIYLLDAIAGKSTKSSCKIANEKQITEPDAFWQRFQVLCLVRDDDNRDKGHLGLELLREQNNVPKLFEVIIGALADKSEVKTDIDVKSLKREELAWLMLSQKMPDIKIEDEMPLEQLALIGLNSDYSEYIKDKGLNLRKVPTPKDSSPSISLSTMRLKKDAKMKDVRRALLALAMRRAWDKPVSVETEDALLTRQYKGEMVEINQIWRESVNNMQDNGHRLAALFHLLKPVDGSLANYTVSDLSFLVRELQALGLPNDATAIAEEALAGND